MYKVIFLAALFNGFIGQLYSIPPTSFSVVVTKTSKSAHKDSIAALALTEPAFSLDSYSINGQRRMPATINKLWHNENDIEINYSYRTEPGQRVDIRYRLNVDSPWVYNNEQKIRFTSLAPGAYLFQLQYSLGKNHWHEALAPLPLFIRFPWWTRWYFFAGLAFGGVVVVGSVYIRHLQVRFKRKQQHLTTVNEHQQKLIQSEIVSLERERNRIAKELHDGVGTNLTAIKLMVNQLLTNHKEPLASDVEEQFQIALKEIKEIIYTLTPPSLERYGLFTALHNYVHDINNNIPITITLRTYGQEINNYDFNLIVFRVLQELLSNSIKHSFANQINIHLNSFDDLLNIVYEDDGIGFKFGSTQNGFGLDNVESRIKSINGTLKFDSGKFGISYNIDIPVTFKTEIA